MFVSFDLGLALGIRVIDSGQGISGETQRQGDVRPQGFNAACCMGNKYLVRSDPRKCVNNGPGGRGVYPGARTHTGIHWKDRVGSQLGEARGAANQLFGDLD